MNSDNAHQIPTLEVEPTQASLQSWISRSHISEEVRTQLRKANVLITPNEGYPEFEDVLYFPEGTEALISFLRENQRDDVQLDICIEDEDYKELARHADLLVIADILSTLVVAPVVADLIGEFIKRRLGSRASEATVKFQLTVQDDQAGRSVSLSYEGPADEYSNYIQPAIQAMNQPLIAQPSEPKKLRRSASGRKKRKKSNHG